LRFSGRSRAAGKAAILESPVRKGKAGRRNNGQTVFAVGARGARNEHALPDLHPGIRPGARHNSRAGNSPRGVRLMSNMRLTLTAS
jgi:hypothetical protein